MVFREPALVGVAGARIEAVRYFGDAGLRRHVGDADAGFVGADADLAALVGGVGAVVDDALRVVRVAAAGAARGEVVVAACELRRGGRGEVDDVQPRPALRPGRRRLRARDAHGVGEARVFVDDEVVGRPEPPVVGRLGEGDGRVGDAAQLREVEHLHPVGEGLADDVGVVGVHLNVAPQRRRRAGRQEADHGRVARVGHVHERGRVAQADEGVLAACGGVRPTPDIVGAARGGAQVGEREVREQVDVAAREAVGGPVRAVGAARRGAALGAGGRCSGHEPGRE